jgi:hypothetical protein
VDNRRWAGAQCHKKSQLIQGPTAVFGDALLRQVSVFIIYGYKTRRYATIRSGIYSKLSMVGTHRICGAEEQNSGRMCFVVATAAAPGIMSAGNMNWGMAVD